MWATTMTAHCQEARLATKPRLPRKWESRVALSTLHCEPNRAYLSIFPVLRRRNDGGMTIAYDEGLGFDGWKRGGKVDEQVLQKNIKCTL